MQVIGRAGLYIATLAALVALSGCGEDSDDEASKSSGTAKPAERGFESRAADDRRGTEYRGAQGTHLITFKDPDVPGRRVFPAYFYVERSCQTFKGVDPVLKAMKGQGKPWPYVDGDGRFELRGIFQWHVGPTGRGTGFDEVTARGKVAADSKSVTISWPKFGCGQAGDNVVMKLFK